MDIRAYFGGHHHIFLKGFRRTDFSAVEKNKSRGDRGHMPDEYGISFGGGADHRYPCEAIPAGVYLEDGHRECLILFFLPGSDFRERVWRGGCLLSERTRRAIRAGVWAVYAAVRVPQAEHSPLFPAVLCGQLGIYVSAFSGLYRTAAGGISDHGCRYRRLGAMLLLRLVPQGIVPRARLGEWENEKQIRFSDRAAMGAVRNDGRGIEISAEAEDDDP